MIVEVFHIIGRNRANPFFLSEVADFTLAPAGRISAHDLVASPDWVIYALDVPQRQVLLVELPEGTDLAQAVFVYSDTYEKAGRAALISFDQLLGLSARLTVPRIAFLFSTGRCGSNLASRIFAQLPEVWSLAEPDFFGNVAVWRHMLADDDAAAVVRAATLWTCRLPKGRRAETIVIKPRSEAMMIAETVNRAFPESLAVFMYRDVLGFVESVNKLAQRALGDVFFTNAEPWRLVWSFVMAGQPLSLLEDYFASDHGPIRMEEFHVLVWDQRIDGYLRALRRGMAFTAVHYVDLNSNREAETARLLAGCGVPLLHLHRAMEGFLEDSHRGSSTSNATPARSMTLDEGARAAALLARMGKRDYVDARLPQ